MPRPNQPRDVYAEENLRRRISSERERRGWSFEELAKRMTDVGCSINASAIYKIEKGRPPRRITVDELVGFSRVLNIGAEDLLVPPDLAASQQALEAVQGWLEIRIERSLHERKEAHALRLLRAALHGRPDALQAVRDWIEHNVYRDEDTAQARAVRQAYLAEVTGDGSEVDPWDGADYLMSERGRLVARPAALQEEQRDRG